MPALQEAFYIIAIVFMGLTFILFVALVISVFVIRNKVNKILNEIETRLNQVTTIAERSGEVAAALVGGVARKARKAIDRKH